MKLFDFKKKNQTVETVEKVDQPKRYSDDIEQIHSEFMGAADKLFLEATSILAECEKKDTGKFKRLLSLGFKQVPQVVEGQEVLRKETLSKETIQLVNYYKVNYPNNKFITEEMVRQICYKYNLICGGVDRYKGFVPEKNLREIEKFKVRQKDIFKKICSQSTYGSDIGRVYDDGGSKAISYSSIYDRITVIEPLKICAPVKDMDLTDMKILDGYRIEKHIPDPVVLQPVKGGYLILTAWGDEANDPLVVNESKN